MASDVTRPEFDHLKDRVTTLEREVDGEKMVTRHILEQTRRNGDDLATLKGRFDRLEQRFDGLEGRFDGLEQKFDSLRKELPKIIGDTLRAILRENK